jgi:hypothetical protein
MSGISAGSVNTRWKYGTGLQLDDLAGAKTTTIAEAEQYADLEAAGDGEQTRRLVRAHHQWDLPRLTDVIDLGCKVQSPQHEAAQKTAARS